MTRAACTTCLLAALLVIAAGGPAMAQADDWRTVAFETTQVTAADVAVSADGEWLIFTMLGKLFRLPITGGDAEQLTFGPYYDDDPAISPDGALVAFQSDRDGSEGNLFVLRLADGAITQLTHEPWAARPVWAPHGQSLLYLRLERSEWNPVDSMPRPPAVVRRISLAGGESETVRALAPVWSVFYLRDGRLGWAVVQRDSASRLVTTRIEVQNRDGSIVTTRVLDGIADPIVPSPASDGVYARFAPWDGAPQPADVVFIPVGAGTVRRIMPVSGERGGFGIASGDAMLYLGNQGHLWQVALPGGRRQGMPFRAGVTLMVRERVAAPAWAPVEAGSTVRPRTIQQPQLSPDGSRLVYVAGGRLWQQSLSGGAATALLDRPVAARDPVFSPDGRSLAYLRDEQGNPVIEIRDLDSGSTRGTDTRGDCGYHQLTWSAHGELVAATTCEHEIVAIDPATGAVRLLAKATDWEPFPQLSADGRTLYFLAEFPGTAPSFYAMPLAAPDARVALAPATRYGLRMSLHGRWLAEPVANRHGIRLTALASGSSTEALTQEIQRADGHQFSFTPDGAALLYVAGDTLWRHPLNGDTPEDVPVRLELRAPAPPPVLLRRVRPLDFATGGFGAETSLLLEGGRIRWIGQERGRSLPAGTQTLDAGGRRAIPGLFDMHGHGGGCGGTMHIAYGVTSVRNMGGRIAEQSAFADRSDFTDEALPRCFYSGRIFEGPSGRNEDHFFVYPRGEEDMRGLVRLWHRQGAQFIKLYNRVPWPLQRAATDEAGRLGLPVEAHGYSHEQVVKGVTLGFGALTHWFNPVYDDVLQLFAAAGIRWEPTLGASGGYELAFRADPARFRRAARRNARLADDVLRGLWAERLRSMRAAYERGITFVPGTDSGPAGLALQWELEFYAEAGIPPLEILRLATEAAAAGAGAAEHLGTLEAGKLADLILLDADPLEDIRNTQAIWRVFKGGWQFDPKVLLPRQ